MGIALFKERRFSSRRKLSGLLPGKLSISGQKYPLKCRPTDVSAQGLGIVANIEIPIGSMATLETDTQSVLLEVIWVAPDFGKQDLFRYGLLSLNPDVSIEELFVTYGCLK